ncbi:MAG: FeoA family protein [Syntrophomonadaceae bacterium]|jgi:ferrous iron transport protein A
MNLIELLPGQEATVTRIIKGEAARIRLLAMGITPGSSIVVLARHPFRGPVTIAVGNTRIAIGRELASAIEVDPKV